MARRVVCISGIGRYVVNVVHVVAVVALASQRNRRAGRDTQRVGDVFRVGVTVREAEVAREAAVHFHGPGVVFVARAVGAGQHFGEIREFQIHLPEGRRRRECGVAIRIGRNLVQVRTVYEVIGVRARVGEARQGIEAKVVVDGEVPLDHARVLEIPLVGTAVARISGGRAAPGEHIRKGAHETRGGRIVGKVARIHTQKRVENRAQDGNGIRPSGGPDDRIVVVKRLPGEPQPGLDVAPVRVAQRIWQTNLGGGDERRVAHGRFP